VSHAQDQQSPSSSSVEQTKDLQTSKEELRPICQDSDDAFGSHFDIYLVSCAAIFIVFLPLVLPVIRLGVRNWWQLTHPYHRWFICAGFGIFVFLFCFWGTALAASVGWISPRYAPLLWGVSSNYPAACKETGVSTAGFLWGILGGGHELGILAIPTMASAIGIVLSLCGALYWIVFLLLRHFRPLRPLR
jgi:hypothetical protein